MGSEPIHLEEALSRVEARARPLPVEEVALDEALGRTVAEDVIAKAPVQGFDNSAMVTFALLARRQGSHVLTSMRGADALALLPAAADSVPAGREVEVELLGDHPAVPS